MSDDLTNVSRKAIKMLEIIDSNIAYYSRLLLGVNLKKLSKAIATEFTVWAVCDKYIHERVTLHNSSYQPDCFDTIPKDIFYNRLGGYMGTSKDDWPDVTRDWPAILAESVLSHDVGIHYPPQETVIYAICLDIFSDYYTWEQSQAIESMQSAQPMSDSSRDAFKKDPNFNIATLIEYHLSKNAYRIIPKFKSVKSAVEHCITKLKPISEWIITDRFYKYAEIGFEPQNAKDHLKLTHYYIYYTYKNNGRPIPFHQFRYHTPPHPDELEIISQRHRRFLRNDLENSHDKKKNKTAIIIIIGIILLMIIATLTK